MSSLPEPLLRQRTGRVGKARGLSLFASVKDSQYDNLSLCHLVANLVLRGKNAPDFPGSEAREPLPEARLRRDELDATENQTYGTVGCARIDRL